MVGHYTNFPNLYHGIKMSDLWNFFDEDGVGEFTADDFGTAFGEEGQQRVACQASEELFAPLRHKGDHIGAGGMVVVILASALHVVLGGMKRASDDGFFL